MRLSHGQKLLDIEHERRRSQYSRHARVTQLQYATAICFVLYGGASYFLWRNGRPSSQVWIDDVLVEVVESSWLDQVRDGCLWMGALCGAMLLVMLLFTRSNKRKHQREQSQRRRQPVGSAVPIGSLPTGSTIAVPSQQGSMQGLRDVSKTLAGRPLASTTPYTTTAWSKPSFYRHVSGKEPMRTSTDLDNFLKRELHKQQREQNVSPVRTQLRRTSFLQDALHTAASLLPNGHAPSDGAISVRYEVNKAHGSKTATDSVVDVDWASLGVLHVEQALLQVRMWVSGVCRQLISDIDQCNKWFEERQISPFGCNYSLQEMVPAAPMPTSVGWGASASSQPTTVQQETKYSVLVREKELVRSQQRTAQDFDTALRYDQRLVLESKLDLNTTFPQDNTLSSAQLSARQHYIIERLRTFSKQSGLVSFKNNGGDTDSWREGFPCDAHLLLHVLRTSVEGLSNYVKFGYQASRQRNDLALFVGDTGEPYFYVRHRSASGDRLHATRPGSNSLFEAVLVLAAIIHMYHDDHYGGIGGMMDLQRMGLSTLFSEDKGKRY